MSSLPLEAYGVDPNAKVVGPTQNPYIALVRPECGRVLTSTFQANCGRLKYSVIQWAENLGNSQYSVNLIIRSLGDGSTVRETRGCEPPGNDWGPGAISKLSFFRVCCCSISNTLRINLKLNFLIIGYGEQQKTTQAKSHLESLSAMKIMLEDRKSVV